MCLCSISDMFPPVSLNFAGGASMMLRPQDYLFHYGFYVSSSACYIYIKVVKPEQSDVIF